MKHDLWLLAALYFSCAVKAEVASNYTDAILSSGTVKLGDWQDAYEKASTFVDSLSTSEKLSIITGGGGRNLSGIEMLDSSSNPINYYFVTAWPAPLAIAMTWDKNYIVEQGEALGAEFKGKGVNVGYGPTVQPLGRSPWGGRGAETYGPDSYFSGIMSGGLVQGMNKAGRVSGAKHFILNEQETNRQGSSGGMGGMGGGQDGPGGNSTGDSPGGTSPSNERRQVIGNTTSSSSEAYSVTIDDKAFHETYLATFYDTIRAGVGAVMCSMNRINDTYGCENQETLSKHLKTELGFVGFVSPDAGGQKTGIGSANAGLDYGSSSYWSNSTLGAGIANGSFTEARLNDMVIRNLMGYFKHGQDVSYPTHAGYTDAIDVRANHSLLARKFAQNSLALLKNTNNALPLTAAQRVISIFGTHAAPRIVGPNTALTVQSGVASTMDGHMSQIGGSAMSSAAYLVTPFQAFNERAAKDGFMLKWWLNNTVVTSSGSGMMVSDGTGTEISETTTGIAENSDACVVFINAWSGEGADRSELRNEEQDALVTAVADACNNTIVVVNTVGPRLLTQWDSHENVTAILYGGPLGQESGYAINDVLFGDVNPSGKLVHTLAKNESDYDSNTQISEESELVFSEGNFIDYKYFDQQNKTPAYPFGFGLSYTTFGYASNLSISSDSDKLATVYALGDLAVGGREDLWDIVATVATSVSNTGSVAGAEVAQLYVEFPAAADEPVRQLRGFQKVAIQPGQVTAVKFELRRRDLSIWDVSAQEWAVVRGEYKFWVGTNSRELGVSTTLSV
ncbi:glycoside hydrolase superfamily [Paraphoma chrysanthemicola]|uniref:beta-glucosidase n=1 Tax=Paraphoma chrysanthemicola TaxID=798071 RepID=A0A8K0QXS8_9PLEO|nr:glycoside hydrolase superfamily [Paraphoma chrysanthemicola]